MANSLGRAIRRLEVSLGHLLEHTLRIVRPAAGTRRVLRPLASHFLPEPPLASQTPQLQRNY